MGTQVALRERHENVGGFSTRVARTDGVGPAVVLVHGFGDSADTWRPLMRRLAAAGTRTVALDLPGFAEAERLRSGLILPQMREAIADLIELEADGSGGDVIVVGNSLGGGLALRLLDDPALPIERVIALAPAGVWTPGWTALVQHDPLVRALLHLPLPAPPRSVRYLVEGIVGRLAFTDPRSEHATAFARHYRSRLDVKRLHETLQRILPELRPPLRLAGIEHPVTIVWGDRDRLITRRGFESIVARAPDGELVVLEGCGHLPQIERTREVAEIVLGVREQASARPRPTPV